MLSGISNITIPNIRLSVVLNFKIFKSIFYRYALPFSVKKISKASLSIFLI